MQVSVESISELGRVIHIAIPEEQIREKVDARIEDLVRTTHLPGFRPGKVPVRIIRQRFAKNVRGEVIGDTVESSLTEAIKQHELKPTGSPQIELITDDDQENFRYTATFEVYPRIDLSLLSSLTVHCPIATVEDQNIDQMIQTFRKNRQTWQPITRAAEIGDRVSLTIESNGDDQPLADKVVADGIEFASGQAEVELDPSYHPQAAPTLCGVNVGESRTITLPPTEATTSPKPTALKVRVDQIQEPILPQVDADFIALYGIEDKTLDSFRVHIRQYMEKELVDRIEKTTKQRVFDALVNGLRFELPAAVVAEEKDRIREDFDKKYTLAGNEDEKISAYIEQSARREATLRLIIMAVLETEKIQVDEQQVHQKIDAMVSTYDDQDKIRDYFYGNEQQLSRIRSLVLEQQIVDRILDLVNVEEEPSSFDALMNPHLEAETSPDQSAEPTPDAAESGEIPAEPSAPTEDEQPPPQC